MDAVTAFLKLFCKSAKIHERRSLKTGKSTAYFQVGERLSRARARHAAVL